jgi:predicted DCC family thiol-disulfide oxidoreductase YuxK
VTGLLIVDGDCAFCTSAAEFAHLHINRDADVEPWQHSDLASLGLTEHACRQAVQYRDEQGVWSSAGHAVSALLRDSLRPWSWLGRLMSVPGMSGLTERTYSLIAANRYRLPGGTAACRAQNAEPAPALQESD